MNNNDSGSSHLIGEWIGPCARAILLYANLNKFKLAPYLSIYLSTRFHLHWSKVALQMFDPKPINK